MNVQSLRLEFGCDDVAVSLGSSPMNVDERDAQHVASE